VLLALLLAPAAQTGADTGPSISPELRGHQDIALLIDPENGIIIDANNAALEFYGYPAETLRTMRIQDINQLSPDEVAMEFRRARDEQRNYFIFPHRLADGTIRPVEVYSSNYIFFWPT
jgi:PAS domain S-box-containing protein